MKKPEYLLNQDKVIFRPQFLLSSCKFYLILEMDLYTITPSERMRHESQFASLGPVNGYISGEQARGFLMQSQLPQQVLAKIW